MGWVYFCPWLRRAILGQCSIPEMSPVSFWYPWKQTCDSPWLTFLLRIYKTNVNGEDKRWPLMLSWLGECKITDKIWRLMSYDAALPWKVAANETVSYHTRLGGIQWLTIRVANSEFGKSLRFGGGAWEERSSGKGGGRGFGKGRRPGSGRSLAPTWLL